MLDVRALVGPRDERIRVGKETENREDVHRRYICSSKVDINGAIFFSERHLAAIV